MDDSHRMRCSSTGRNGNTGPPDKDRDSERNVKLNGWRPNHSKDQIGRVVYRHHIFWVACSYCWFPLYSIIHLTTTMSLASNHCNYLLQVFHQLWKGVTLKEEGRKVGKYVDKVAHVPCEQSDTGPGHWSSHPSHWPPAHRQREADLLTSCYTPPVNTNNQENQSINITGSFDYQHQRLVLTNILDWSVVLVQSNVMVMLDQN